MRKTVKKQIIVIIIIIALFINIFVGCATTSRQPLTTTKNDTIKQSNIVQNKVVKDDKKLLGYWGGAILGALLSQVIAFQLIIPGMAQNKTTEEQLAIIFFVPLLSMVVGMWGGSTLGYNIQDVLDGEQ
jgi:hypothetical protein